MPILTNRNSGEQVTTRMTLAEAAMIYAEAYNDGDHWLHFWLHKLANEQVDRQRKAATSAASPGGRSAVRFLSDLFLVATGYGLKRPMIRLHYRGQRFKLYLSARGTLCLKTGHLAPCSTCGASGQVEDPITERFRPCPDCGVEGFSHDPVGDEQYAGCWANCREFSPAGVGGYGRPSPRRLTPTEAEFLKRLEDDPVKFMAECSKDMGRCCYCNLPLEDPQSKEVGYGPVCAKRWGLPWGGKGRAERVPPFAEVYDETAAGMLQAIRERPEDVNRWEVFGDWLGERGLPRCAAPKGRVAIPRG